MVVGRYTKEEPLTGPAGSSIADQEAKLAAQRASEALSQGQIPHNPELERALDITKESIESQQQKGQLTQEGQKIAEDSKRLVETLKEVVHEKNKDEHLQKLAFSTAKAADATDIKGTGKMAAQASSQASIPSETLEKGWSASVTLARHIISSSDFRQQLTDLWQLLKDMLSNRSPDGRVMLLTGDLKDSELEELVNRTHTIVCKIAERESSRQSILSLLDVYDELRPRFLMGAEALKQASVTPSSAASYNAEAYRTHARHEAQKLLESFAQNKSLDPMWASHKKLWEMASKDNELSAFARDDRAMFEKTLDSSEYARSETWRKDARRMLLRAREILGKYREPLESILRETDEFMDCLKMDTTTQKFTQATEMLAKDLFLDQEGKVVFKPNALLQVRKLVIPALINLLKFIPVPRIEGEDDTVAYCFDDIVFKGKDVIPDQVRVENSTKAIIDTSLGQTNQDVVDSSLYVLIEDVTTSIPDLAFNYKRKTFPRIEDRGRADLTINGKIEIWLKFSNLDKQHILRPAKVSCDLDKVQLTNVRGEEHDWLYTFFRPMIQNMIRRKLERAIEENMLEFVLDLDTRLQSMSQSAATSAATTEIPIA